jgi:hypothetical protein
MQDDRRTYADLLKDLQHPAQKRDPRAIRLAAVTGALCEVVGGDEVASAAQVYAKAVATLEGTLHKQGDDRPLSTADSVATQTALLELLHVTIPRVESAALLAATLPLTSRVLRAITAVNRRLTDQGTLMETADELGGTNAVLRWTCRACCAFLKRLDSTTADSKAIRQLFTGTLIALFQDRRPKVRKAAHNGTLEVLQIAEAGDGLFHNNSNNNKCHPVIIKTMSQYVHEQLSKAPNNSEKRDGDLLHLLSFLERAILYLNHSKLGADCMELLTTLLHTDTASVTTDFVAVSKVREGTQKILTVSSLLSVALSMLEDISSERKEALDQFAPRVLASLLQAKPSLIFRSGIADLEILQQGRIKYGQVILGACHRILESDTALACKLLPLSIQMVLLLSRPCDEDPEDASVAQSLCVELMHLFRAKLPSLTKEIPLGLQKCLEDSLRSLEHVMDHEFRPTWSISLKCLVVFLEETHGNVEAGPCVESLVQLHSDVSAGSSSLRAVDDALSTLVQGVGIEVCWEWIRWESETTEKKGTCVLAVQVFLFLHYGD